LEAHDHEQRLTPDEDLRIAREALAGGDLKHAAFHAAWAIEADPSRQHRLAILAELTLHAANPPHDFAPLGPANSHALVAIHAYVLAKLGQMPSAGLHQAQGRMKQARGLYEQALAIHRELGHSRLEGIMLGRLADLLRLEGSELSNAGGLAAEGETLVSAVGDKLHLGVMFCVRGHIALAGGQSGRQFRHRAQALADEVGAGSASELGRGIAKLRRAQEAFEAGEHHRLFRGELPEDLPEGLRRWLRETGQLSDQKDFFGVG
jgi:hypothetical protein